MLFLLTFLLVPSSMESTNKEAQAFGERYRKHILSRDTADRNAILAGPKAAPTMQSVSPDARSMMDGIQENQRQHPDAANLKGDVLVENMIARGDEYVNNPDKPLAISMKTHTPHDQFFECTESTAVPHAFFYRTLNMNVKYTPYQARVTRQEKQTRKVCVKRIKRCSSIFSWTTHQNDDPNCRHSSWEDGPQQNIEPYQDCRSLGWHYFRDYLETTEKTVEVSPEIHERTDFISEKWDVEGDPHNLFGCVQRNACNIIETECLEGPAARQFYTMSIHRNCWRQRITVLCPGHTVNTCAGLRKKGCEEVDTRCTEYTSDGRCLTYKKQYRCPARKKEMIDGGHNGIHCIDGGSLVAKPTAFEDMAASLAQLSVLGEIEKEMKTSFNAHNVRVFKGDCHRCKKNVLAHLLYDCCGTLDGFALSLNLTDCDDKERRLASLRAKDVCYYVGSFQNAFMLWHSSDTHVYCCFHSKLVMHLQKEARRLLGIGWGSPQTPDCEGLTMEELTRVDFSKMDLSPLFDDIMKNAQVGPPKIDLKQAESRMHQKMQTLDLRIKPW